LPEIMMSDEDPNQLLTAIDAARILGLSTDMVRVLTRKGRLPSQRAANGYHLFRRQDVERLAEERRISSAARASRGPRSGGDGTHT
jgi:predicted site-specific integrase-resolvase